MKKVWILALNSIVALMLMSGCGGSSQPNVELLQDMMEGPDYKAQEGDGDKPTVRVPPKGTISRNRYVPTDLKIEGADQLVNPLKTISAEELFKYENIGQEKYKIYCGICHGDKGDGKGQLVEVAGKSLVTLPPSLIQDKYKGYSEGKIYYVITYGWGLMGKYSTQITDEKERWAVANYVKQLQKMSGSSSSSEDASKAGK